MAQVDRKKRDKDIRRQDILKAAAHLFATEGYHNASMSSIAKESQYAVGTLYLYFKSKESIYLALLEHKKDELFNTVREAVSKVKSGSEKIRTLVETQISYFQENVEFFQILFSEKQILHKAADENYRKKQFERMHVFLDYTTSIIKQAQKENYIDREFSAGKIARVLLGMMHAVFFTSLRYKRNEYENFEIESDFVLKIFLEGVGVKK